ncbi:MAG: carbohydrate ABC transporter permease [Chloroflexi bacterium]|nr:carbohydrate ABC transporter permease [Chloroflexota bacterium]MBV9602941.1 carbohydrate ABC transporter permease [Chloroflexota bacterium]
MAATTSAVLPTRRRARVNTRKLVENGAAWIALAFFVVIAVFPVFWMFMTSVKADRDLVNPSTIPFWFQQPLTLDHYVYLFTATKFTTWLGNTFLISSCVVLITLVVCIPAAYALARLKFIGAEHIGIGVFLSYVVPPTILFLPLAQILAGHGLYNTKWGLVVVYPTFTIPFCLWLLAGFFRTVPLEIEEAALVDGCNRWQAVVRVVLPLSLAGIMTVAIFAFTLAMQEFVYALTFVSSSTEKPVTLGIPTDLIRGDVYFWGSLMAGALLAGIPVAILYNFFLDYFVEGITGGALK